MFVSASAGPIFASKALILMLAACVLAVVPYFLVLRRDGLRISEPRHVRLFFILWLAVFTFEYYFLGPYSFVEQTTEGNLSVAYNYYLTHGYDGGRLSHEYGGGQDAYILMFGRQFFNPDRMLIGVLPLWVAIFLHKAFVGAVGFVGAYLLARRLAPGNRGAAVAAAAIFPVSHYYLLNWSTNWSPGFAVLPIVVYLCVARSGESRYWPGVLLAALVTTPSEPIHLLPALAVAVIGSVFLFDAMNWRRVALSFAALIVLSFANWHEVLYAFYQNIDLTSRIQGRAQGGGGSPNPGFFTALWEGFGVIGSQMWLVFFLFTASLVALAARRDRYLPRALWAFAWPVVAFAVATNFPWPRIGLGFLAHLTHEYMFLSSTALLLPVLARTLSVLEGRHEFAAPWRQWLSPVAAVLAVALAVLTWNKAVNLGLLAWFGGQANMTAYQPLNRNDWKPKADFRVISIYDTPNANITAGMYRLDAFDGQMNVNHAGWDDYWFSIIRLDRTLNFATRAGVKWRHWNGRAYDVEGHLRLDLLGIANVRFLLSPLPLEGGGLKPVVAPAAGEQAKRRPESFKSQVDFLKFRLRRVFDPGTLYIYELPRFLPRVFAATGIEAIDRDADSVALHDRVGALAPEGVAVVAADRVGAFQGLGALGNLKYAKVTDGYDVTMNAPEGGILVVNNMYAPFWQAKAGDGRTLAVVPANAVQMAVPVPPGTETVRVRYRRPLLRETVAQLLH